MLEAHAWICSLKGYCIVFQHPLKLLEITGIALTYRMSKTARENSKVLKSYKELNFNEFKYAKTHMTSFDLFRLIKLKKISPFLYIYIFFSP